MDVISKRSDHMLIYVIPGVSCVGVFLCMQGVLIMQFTTKEPETELIRGGAEI